MRNFLNILLFLCIPLFISCSNDDYDFPKSKEDINFKGKSLETVKKSMQGVWHLSNVSGERLLDDKATRYVITIAGDKISLTPVPTATTFAGSPRMYDIIWSEVTERDTGEKMHAFSPKYDNWELINSVPFVPHEIKDNVLKISMGIESEDRFEYYKYNYNE